MLKLKDKNYWWILAVISLSNGICIVVLSGIMFHQMFYLLKQQRLQKDAFEHVHREPFKNSNWMKSAIPLVIACTLGIVIGALQLAASIICLVMDNSKSFYRRRVGWLIWMAAGIIIFTLSTLSFSLAVMLKAHQYRDPQNSISFWTNYQFNTEVTHHTEGHAFCSALAWNCCFLLASIAVVALKVFRPQKTPHYLLGM